MCRKSRIRALLLTLAALLAACQPTPEEEPVVNKGDGALMELVLATAAPEQEQTARVPYSAPARYEEAFVGYSDNLSVEIDAEVIAPPEAPIPVYEAQPLEWTDAQADGAVKMFARRAGWKPRTGNEENVASAIGFLERTYKVNYDQRHSADVGDLFRMSTKNHHIKSLSHSPDVVGLFFSVLNQFTSTATFVSGAMYSTYGTSVPSGWLVPLSYINVGRQSRPDEEIARVKLIVPHSQGQSYASQNVYPCFYDITYQRER